MIFAIWVRKAAAMMTVKITTIHFTLLASSTVRIYNETRFS